MSLKVGFLGGKVCLTELGHTPDSVVRLWQVPCLEAPMGEVLLPREGSEVGKANIPPRLSKSVVAGGT